MEDNNQNIASQPSSPVENQNISSSISSKSSAQGSGPFLLVLIIVAVVVAAGGWFLMQNNQPAPTPQVESKSSRQYQQVSPTPTQAVDDQVKSLKIVSSSDDLSAIEKDLNSTDFGKLDQETTEINQSLTSF